MNKTKKELVQELAHKFKILKDMKIVSVTITKSILNKQTMEELKSIEKSVDDLFKLKDIQNIDVIDMYDDIKGGEKKK